MISASASSASCSTSDPSSGASRSRWRWVYPFALAAMVVVASGRGQVAAPNIVNIDKLIHFSVFGLLATLVARAPGMRRAWIAVLVVSFFGISDEIRQSFTPGRSVEFADWVADTSGALLAVTLYTFWTWYRRLLEMPLGRKRGSGHAAASTPSPESRASRSRTVSVA